MIKPCSNPVALPFSSFFCIISDYRFLVQEYKDTNMSATAKDHRKKTITSEIEEFLRENKKIMEELELANQILQDDNDDELFNLGSAAISYSRRNGSGRTEKKGDHESEEVLNPNNYNYEDDNNNNNNNNNHSNNTHKESDSKRKHKRKREINNNNNNNNNSSNYEEEEEEEEIELEDTDIPPLEPHSDGENVHLSVDGSESEEDNTKVQVLSIIIYI